MMGVPNPPNLEAILSAASVPIKLSCVLDRHNLPELGGYLQHSLELGIRRLALVSSSAGGPGPICLTDGPACSQPLTGTRFSYGEMEVTLWDFERAVVPQPTADGTISPEYLLARASLALPYLHRCRIKIRCAYDGSMA
jgi:hypothetical protein